MVTRALLTTVATSLLAAPVLAADKLDTMSVAVRTVDLDLSLAGDRARLDRRVRQAAGRICGAAPRALEFQQSHRACRSEVLGDAQVQIARMIERSAPILVARRAD